MEILQLRYFYDSAKTESFAKTAEKYMVPATSVSAAVKRLENELGCKLFDRHPNSIILNNNGKELFNSLSIVFSELDSVSEKLSYINTDNREIKILVRSIRHAVINCIIEYKKRHPSINFKPFFDFDKSDFENYDIIIDDQRNNHPGFEKILLTEHRLTIRASKENPLCGKKLTLKQLKNQPFVSMGEESNMHKILVSSCERAGFSPNIAVFCNDAQCYKKLIASNIGVGIGRGNSASSDLIEALDISDFNETQTICAYCKKEAAYGNIKNFTDFLKSKFM